MSLCIFSEKEEGVKGSSHGRTCRDQKTSSGKRRKKSAGFGANCVSIRNEEKNITNN